MTDREIIIANLMLVASEMDQPSVAAQIPPSMATLRDQLQQIDEFLGEANEFALAYESIVSLLELFPFAMSGPASVRLLEAGLLLRYKTDRPADARFDVRI